MSSPLASVAESRIQECIENGEHMDLAGMGKPLDMEAHFRAPSSLRAGFGLLKSAGVVPPEVEAMRVVAFLREQIELTTDAEKRASLRAELQTHETELAMGLERMKHSIKADAAI
ncbi:MAG TPA: DUF1992 domain-containing protein [Candidatus Saccharimonadia bacterium]|nr:DUF1992 domain-containing protein [Candidatus Saccharimonadia bacterium]